MISFGQCDVARNGPTVVIVCVMQCTFDVIPGNPMVAIYLRSVCDSVSFGTLRRTVPGSLAGATKGCAVIHVRPRQYTISEFFASCDMYAANRSWARYLPFLCSLPACNESDPCMHRSQILE